MIALDGPSLKLGVVAGIPIKLHWSFSLLILFVFYIAYSNQIPEAHVGRFFAYVFLLFLFVVMHEYGHALTARRFGIKTRDIILSPIGGIARLERMPVKPSQELLVALAGPAVNVVLSLIFLIVQLTTSDFVLPQSETINFGDNGEFISYLLVINIVLVVFNMIPAFPMDGGRVLRSIFSMILKDPMKATKWAVFIGQIMALVFIYVGFVWDQYVLMFIGIFVFFTARTEYRQMKLLRAMNMTRIKEVMRQNYTLLDINEPLTNAINNKSERNFLVSGENGIIVGALPELFIKSAKRDNETDRPIGEFMSRAFGALSEDLSLTQAFQILNQNGWSIAQVHDAEGNKKGVIDRQLLSDFMRKSK